MEPQVSRLGARPCRRLAPLRRHPAPQHAGGRPARVQPADRRGPDRGPRALGGRGGGADHRPAGTGPAQRRGLARHYPQRVDPRPVQGRADLRARHRPAPGQAGGHRAADPVGRPAPGGQAAGDDPAAVVDQPGHDGRALLKGAHPHRGVGAGPLDDPAPPDGRARGGQRVHLGAARAPAPGPGRPCPAAAGRHHPQPAGREHRQRPVGVAADLPGGVDARHRRVH
jgi:hypothetical protein